MSSELPPRPSKRATVALAVVALVTFLYSVVIAAQILLWFVLVGLAIGLYLTYLLIVAVFRLVEAVERLATAAEVDSGIRTAAEVGDSPDDGDASATPESGRHSADADADSVVPDEDGASPDDASPDDRPGNDDASPDDRPDGG